MSASRYRSLKEINRRAVLFANRKKRLAPSLFDHKDAKISVMCAVHGASYWTHCIEQKCENSQSTKNKHQIVVYGKFWQKVKSCQLRNCYLEVDARDNPTSLIDWSTRCVVEYVPDESWRKSKAKPVKSIKKKRTKQKSRIKVLKPNGTRSVKTYF